MAIVLQHILTTRLSTSNLCKVQLQSKVNCSMALTCDLSEFGQEY